MPFRGATRAVPRWFLGWTTWLALTIYAGCLVAFLADLRSANELAFGVFYSPMIVTAVFYRDKRAVWVLTAIVFLYVCFGGLRAVAYVGTLQCLLFAAGITGIRTSSSNPALTLPAEARDYPNAVSQAVSALRLAGVGGPFSLLLSVGAYTMVSETSDHGYPIREHLARVIDGEIIWAPAIDGAFLVSGRGGDFELQLGQDLSIGYAGHDEHSVRLYIEESFSFIAASPEAAVALTA